MKKIMLALTLVCLTACGSSADTTTPPPNPSVSPAKGDPDGYGFSIQYVDGIKCIVYSYSSYPQDRAYSISCDFGGN